MDKEEECIINGEDGSQLLVPSTMFSRRAVEVNMEELYSDSDTLVQNWLSVMRSWKGFLNWLDDRWWGSVSRDDIATFLRSEKGRCAVVVSEPLEPKIGALCSVTKQGSSDAVLTTEIAMERGLYVCKELKGYYDDPRDIVLLLGCERTVARKPSNVTSSQRSFFADARIPERLHRLIRGPMGKVWWGTYTNLAQVPKLTYPLTALQRQRRPSAMIALTDVKEERGPGYLFEIMYLSKRNGGYGLLINKCKVVFGIRGFTVVCGPRDKKCLAYHMDMEALVYGLSRLKRLIFLSK